jgi:hypothetical protein
MRFFALPVPALAGCIFPLLALAALGLSSCQPRTAVDPNGLSVIRTYRFDSVVSDPQPAWNPASYMIVARTLEGFALLQEGAGRQEYFASEEARQTWYPAWANRDQFVFGPMRNVTAVGDGRVVASTDGLTVVTVEDNGLKCSVTRTVLASLGFHPRPLGDRIYAQAENKMVIVDHDGKVADAGEGFFPEPQADGPGIAWQETPLTESDAWTGKSGRGRLFVRWKPGVVSEIPGGCEARWTATGGLVCTVLRADPPADRPWWTVGTDVVYLAEPGAEPVVVAKNARAAAPHPKEALIAVADAAAGIRLVSLRQPQAAEVLLAVAGSAPAWSFDGLRLLAVEPKGDGPGTIVVRVLKERRFEL